MTGASERAELIFWRLRVRRRTDQSLTASISHLGNKEAFPSTLSVCELQKYHMETNSPPVQVARPIFFGPIIVLSPFCRIGMLFLWFLLLLASLQGAGAVLCWGADVGCLLPPLIGVMDWYRRFYRTTNESIVIELELYNVPIVLILAEFVTMNANRVGLFLDSLTKGFPSIWSNEQTNFTRSSSLRRANDQLLFFAHNDGTEKLLPVRPCLNLVINALLRC